MNETDFFETLDEFHGGISDIFHNHLLIYEAFFETQKCGESLFCKNYFRSQGIFFKNVSRYFSEYKRNQDIPFFNSLKKAQAKHHLLETFKHCEGGIVKRLDETREFYEFIVKNTPDIFRNNFLLLRYLTFQDEFLLKLIQETHIESSFKLRNIVYQIPEKTFSEVTAKL